MDKIHNHNTKQRSSYQECNATHSSTPTFNSWTMWCKSGQIRTLCRVAITPNQNVMLCGYQAQSERCVVWLSGPIRTLCRVVIRSNQNVVSCGYKAQSERCVVWLSGPIRKLCLLIIRPNQKVMSCGCQALSERCFVWLSGHIRTLCLIIIRPNQKVMSCGYQAQSERYVVWLSGPIRRLCLIIARPNQNVVSCDYQAQNRAWQTFCSCRHVNPSLLYVHQHLLEAGLTFRCCFVQVRKEYRLALGKADWMPGCCRQCLLLLLGTPIQRQVAPITGPGTVSVKISPSLTSKPTNASSPSKIVEVRSPR